MEVVEDGDSQPPAPALALVPGQELGPWLLKRGLGRGVLVLSERLLATLDRFYQHYIIITLD